MKVLWFKPSTTHRAGRLPGLVLVAWLQLTLGLDSLTEAGVPTPPASSQTPGRPESRARGPVAIAFDRDRRRLIVANRKSGSLSVLDAQTRRWLGEFHVGKTLADLTPLPGDGEWAVVDQDDNALIHLRERAERFEVVARHELRSDPVRLVLSPDQTTLVVASRWGRCLSFFSWDRVTRTLSQSRTLELPFSPQDMLPVREGTALIVADAFGGNLASIDTRRGRVLSVRTLQAHNIRGLAASSDGGTVLLAHQELNPKARAIQDDVQWGALMSSKVRVLDLDGLLKEGPGESTRPLDDQDRRIDLGRVSGDPAALLCGRDGQVALALAGVDQIALGRDVAHIEVRTATGRRPTALAADWDRHELFVAETLDDTVSVYDLRAGKRLARIALGPEREPTLEDRGERLYFDARLSRGGWMSCQSCHTDGHSNGLNVDTIGDGGYGAPKRVPTLLGVGSTGPWSWNGRMERLDEQVHQSAVTTVQGVWPTESEVAELTAYLLTLKAPTPPLISPSSRPAAQRGEALFEAKCATCHAPPEYTTAGRFDVGLADEVGGRSFNPPSLRGVGRRTPLLHDGRAKSLEEVFRTHGHPRNTHWTDQEISDLLRFLESL
jgi:cytochrome c peroxidase